MEMKERARVGRTNLWKGKLAIQSYMPQELASISPVPEGPAPWSLRMPGRAYSSGKSLREAPGKEIRVQILPRNVCLDYEATKNLEMGYADCGGTIVPVLGGGTSKSNCGQSCLTLLRFFCEMMLTPLLQGQLKGPLGSNLMWKYFAKDKPLSRSLAITGKAPGCRLLSPAS